MPFPYTFSFRFQDKRDSKYSDPTTYEETDKSPASAEYEDITEKSPTSSEYSGTQDRSLVSWEYRASAGFPYTFTFAFADARDSRYQETSTYSGTINKSGLDDEYDTTQTRSGFPSSY